MGASVRPVLATPDDAEFEAWKAQQGHAPAPTTHDDAEFNAWKQGGNTGDIDLRKEKPESTAVHPAPVAGGADGGIADAIASGLSFGLAPKIHGAISAVGDLVQHHSLSHAGQVFDSAVASDKGHLASIRQRAPVASALAEGASSLVPIAASTLLPGSTAVRAAMGLGEEAAPAASVVQRGAQAFRTGAGTGAVLGGATSEGSLGDRLKQTAVAGLGGGLLGAGGQAVGELGGGLARIGKALVTPLETRAANSADTQLMRALSNDGGVESAANRAQSDAQMGLPSVVAHTGGQNTNSLAWKAVSTPSLGGSRLASALTPIKQGEAAVLSRGLGDASGVGDATAFAKSNEIKGRQQVSARNLYETAYNGAPVHDPEITSAIIQQPHLMTAAQKALDIMEREGTATDADRKAVQALQFLASNPKAPVTALAQPMSIRLLDTMKRGADDIVSSGLAKDATFTKLDARNLKTSVGNILDRVDEHSPEYANARMVYKSDADRLDAIEQGQSSLKLPPEQVASAKNSLAPQNQADYTLGGVDAIRQKMSKKLPGSALTQSVFGSDAAQGQLTSLIGKEGRAQFDPYLDYGRRVEATHQRAFGGSSTAGNLKVDQGDEGASMADAAHLVTRPRSALVGLLSRAASPNSSTFQSALADALGERLAIPTGSEPADVLYNKMRDLRDENSADAIGQAVARQLRLRKALGTVAGVASSSILGGNR